MPTILSFSSQVAYGHVGHAASVFAWQRLGIEVIALPTIILSNRPDYPRAGRVRVDPGTLADMLDALASGGMLDKLDAVFTGYMPTAEHAEVVANWLGRLRDERPNVRVMCDPILGDEPGGLYVAEAAARSVRDRILPLADIIKPNSFELGWLTGMAVNSSEAAIEAAMEVGRMMLVTSNAERPGRLINLLVCQQSVWLTEVARREGVPHGSGDMMAALFLGFLLRKAAPAEALALATGAIEAVVDASLGARELCLVESQDAWANPAPWPLEKLDVLR